MLYNMLIINITSTLFNQFHTSLVQCKKPRANLVLNERGGPPNELDIVNCMYYCVMCTIFNIDYCCLIHTTDYNATKSYTQKQSPIKPKATFRLLMP